MKKIVKNVFKSMERDERLFNEETDPRRKNFYSTTKQPMQVEIKAEGTTTFETVKEAIKNLTRYLAIQSTLEINRLDLTTVDPLMIEFSGKLNLAWHREHRSGEGNITRVETVETKRPVKFSTLMNNILEKRMDFCNDIIEDPHGLREYGDELKTAKWLENQRKDLTSLCNKLVKDTTNTAKVSNRNVWIYFTTMDIADHCQMLSRNEGASSCMSKTASYYGSTYNGKYRHPLQGYEYSPDFRLALISNKSPDEIKNCKDDYPFLCRSIVFPTPYKSNKTIAYSRVYGNEKLQRAIGHVAEYVEKPEGYIVYGIMCNDLNDTNETDRISELLRERYEDGEDIEHMIAPYIDTWNNSLVLVGAGTPFIREDGIKVVELRTSCSSSDGDTEDDETDLYEFDDRYVKLSIYYGTAIVQWYRGERDYIWECFYNGDIWDYGRSD